MDKKIIAILLIAILTIVSIASLSYYVSIQPSQTQNSPSPTPEPTSTPTPTPTPVPASSPSEEPTEPASIPKPSVPEFTVELVDNSYDVPPTYKIDEYTGETVLDTGGYHVENMTIYITIKNQPFSYSFNGTAYRLYYNARVKGHFGDNWQELYPAVDRLRSESDDEKLKCLLSPLQSTSGYTVLSFSANDYPDNATIDVQVQALVGHDSKVYVIDYAFIYPIGGHYEQAVALDVASDWSSTKTITIP